MAGEKGAPSFYRRIGRPLVYSLFIAAILGILGYFVVLEMRPVVSPSAPTLKSIQTTTPEPTDPISSQEKSAYTVPPSDPRYLKIDSLSISARILPMDTTGTGALDSPKTAWDVGWYAKSAKPGSSGALLIDGHVNDTRNTLGVFGQLHALVAGDLVTVERGDGQVFTYRVVSVDQVPVEQVDMKKLLQPITSGRQGLNLITCGGRYDSGRQTFTDRVVVYAEQV